MTLAAALKSNEALRSSIQAAGAAGVEALARQDPRDWARAELKAKRTQWMKESLQEAKVPSSWAAFKSLRSLASYAFERLQSRDFAIGCNEVPGFTSVYMVSRLAARWTYGHLP